MSSDLDVTTGEEALDLVDAPEKQYLAFLRGLNVGGHTVKMPALRTMFEELELTDVATILASGNVHFTASGGSSQQHEALIEAHLAERLGYEVLTFIRTPAEVAAVGAFEPFADEASLPGDTLHIGLLKTAPSAAARKAVAAMSNEQDRLRVEGRELYWRIHGGLTSSSLKDRDVLRALGGPTTLRNVNTIRRLAAKYPA
jgi:uncharacterized protein (DUF1697 family)